MKIVRCSVVLMILLSVAVWAAEDAAALKVKIQLANIRQSPEVNAQVIAQAKMGDMFKSTKKIGSWFEITLMDDRNQPIIGYLHQDMVDVVSGKLPSDQQATAPQAAPQQQTEQPQSQRSRPQRTSAPKLPEISSKSFWFSLFGGYSSSGLAWSEEDEWEDVTKRHNTGLTGGLMLEFSKGIISLNLGASYLKQGGKIVVAEGSGTEVIESFTLNEISVPVILKLNFLEGTSPYLIIGSHLGIIISKQAKVQWLVDNDVIDEEEYEEEDLPFKAAEFGLIFGGGFDISIGSAMKIFIEARYLLGMTDLIDQNKIDEAGWDTITTKSSSLGFVAGFRF